MQLYYFQDSAGNFGDDLNGCMWPHFFPQPFDTTSETMMIGIGTLLNDRVPKAENTLVFGSGVGYGSGLPHIDSSWRFYCVRGPLSANKLGLPDTLGVTDPALLLLQTPLRPLPSPKRFVFSFMPHHKSVVAAGKYWEEICRELGFGYINPCHAPQKVLDELNQTEVLIAEAMHGAIAADALRIPWIPVTSHPEILAFKWHDWCATIDQPYHPFRIPLLYERLTRKQDLLRGHRLLFASYYKKQAIQVLRGISKTAVPVLSKESLQAELTQRLLEKLGCLKRDWFL